MAGLKRLRTTFILFGVAVIVAGAVWYTVTEVQRSTNERVNAIVCVTRPYIEGGRASSKQAAEDPAVKPAAKARANEAVERADQFLSGLLLEPRDFNCKPLLKKLLREQKEREKRARAHGGP